MEDESEEQSGGGLPIELLRSYLAFGREALRRWRWLCAAVFVVVAGLTVAAAILWPRTYHSETRMMAQRNEALAVRGDSVADALRGATDTVMTRENLSKIVSRLNLVDAWDQKRAPILKLKDNIMSKIRGPIPLKDRQDALVGLLRDKLVVTVGPNDPSLTLAVDWPDPESAAKIVDTALESFLEARHGAEISMIADYAAILTDHASRSRKRVDQLAQQLKQSRKDNLAKAKEDLKKKDDKDEPAAAPVPRYEPRRPVVRTEDPEEAQRLAAQAEALQRQITQTEDDRKRRLYEQQTKISDLLTKYTDAHPAVVDAKQKLVTLQHESPEVAQMRAQVQDLQDQARKKMSATQAASGLGSTLLQHSFTGGGNPIRDPEALPPEFADLLADKRLLDPSLADEFEGELRKYGALQDQISSAQLDLDTAQLAFNHRYKIVAPAEVSLKPTKPKVSAIVIGGLIGALLLAIASAILAELRTDRIHETWQVKQLALPVLADLRFPPGPSE